MWLLQLLAMVIYEHLLQKFGPMVFSRLMFSYGWAANFMHIWGFSHTKLQGEADSVPLLAIKVEVEVLQQMISRYNLDDVYNTDESGLFLQTSSEWTIDNEKRSGTKSESSCISILFCANAMGSDRTKPFILSK